MAKPCEKIELSVFSPTGRIVTKPEFCVQEWKIEIVEGRHRHLTCTTDTGAVFQISLGEGWTVFAKIT